MNDSFKNGLHEWVEYISHSKKLYDTYGQEKAHGQEDRKESSKEEEEHEEAQIVFEEKSRISGIFL